MLFALTGSSCAGKTTAAMALRGRVPGLAVHDFDEGGVPAGADAHWRDRETEAWIVRALALQARGADLLLTGQSPLGEILAAPSAPRLDGIAVCLVDVADGVRRERLAARDPGRWPPERVEDFIGWARWQRGHAADPRHRPEVLTRESRPRMAWHRWASWRRGGARWSTYTLDTTDRAVQESAGELAAWIGRVREAHAAGRWSLSRGWDEGTPGECG